MTEDCSISDAAQPVAWRVKNDFGHWHITQDKALADTYRDVEKKDVQPLYLAAQPAMGLEDVADIIRDKVYADENDKVGGVYDAAQKVIEYITALAAKPPAAPVETLDFETALRQALDDLAVEDGKCNWAEVANILPRMRGELRAYTPQRLSAETAIAALAKRFWSIHPKEIQDLGITREQFYEREMRALFAALVPNEPQGVSQSSADSGGEWHIQQNIPSDGFECYYLLRDDVVVAEICGPQTEQRTRHLNALVIAANSSAEPQAAPASADSARPGLSAVGCHATTAHQSFLRINWDHRGE